MENLLAEGGRTDDQPHTKGERGGGVGEGREPAGRGGRTDDQPHTQGEGVREG